MEQFTREWHYVICDISKYKTGELEQVGWYTDKMSNDKTANDKTATDKISKDKTANDKMSNATKQLKTKCLMRQND